MTMQAADRKHTLYGCAAVCAIGALALIAYFVFKDAEGWKEALAAYLETARGTPWALPFVCVTYIAGGAVLFPVMVLNLSVAIVFGLWGIVYALCGALASAAFFFGAGRLLKKKYGHKLLAIPKIHYVDTKLKNAGVAGVVAIHIVPFPPYSIVSLSAGLTSITFAEYMTGTLISMLPGAIARGVVGDSLTKLILDPSHESYL